MQSRDDLDRLSPAEIVARLNAAPAQRAAFLRDAAAAGVAEAQAVYAQMLLDGTDVPQDQTAAFNWFTKAAAQHHLMALNMVGRCYDLGWGTTIDKQRAAACFRVAAERGLDWAMYNYATALALGEGVAEDRAAAFAWFQRAAALGNAKAINHVGSFHEDGWATPRDVAEAARCYALAAESGDFRGAFNHARMLAAQGDVDAALDWLERSGEMATPAFVEKACAWLMGQDLAALREKGPAAMRQR
jgi:uncharacterized protein